MEAEVAGMNATYNAIVQASYGGFARKRDGLAAPGNDLHRASGRQGHPQDIGRPWAASAPIPAGFGADKLQAGKVDGGALEMRKAVVSIELEAGRAWIDCAQCMTHPRMPACLPMSDGGIDSSRTHSHPAFPFRKSNCSFAHRIYGGSTMWGSFPSWAVQHFGARRQGRRRGR
jgi:hypothetical protein